MTAQFVVSRQKRASAFESLPSFIFVYRVEGLVKSGDFDKAVDKSREFRYLKLDEWERVQRICQS